ncbi:hypothetical protein AVDCRST_MAG82-140, partial [uncultured Rubrobacteraceae bacterium]
WRRFPSNRSSSSRRLCLWASAPTPHTCVRGVTMPQRRQKNRFVN